MPFVISTKNYGLLWDNYSFSRFGDERLEAACLRALDFDDARYMTVKRILETGRDQQSDEPRSAQPSGKKEPTAFVRSAADLVGHLFGGGVTWN